VIETRAILAALAMITAAVVLGALCGQPPDEALWSEVEAHVKSFNNWLTPLWPFAFALYLFTPFNPSKQLLQAHGQQTK